MIFLRANAHVHGTCHGLRPFYIYRWCRAADGPSAVDDLLAVETGD